MLSIRAAVLASTNSGASAGVVKSRSLIASPLPLPGFRMAKPHDHAQLRKLALYIADFGKVAGSSGVHEPAEQGDRLDRLLAFIHRLRGRFRAYTHASARGVARVLRAGSHRCLSAWPLISSSQTILLRA